MRLIESKSQLNRLKRGLFGVTELEGFDGGFPFYAILDSFNPYVGKRKLVCYSRDKLLELVNNIDELAVSNANGEKE